MPARRPAGLCLLALLACAPAASACLWDADTLWQERRESPGVLELIVGKFPRHTDAFYEWRVTDRRKRLALHDSGVEELDANARAGLYDDLAVALDKLGRRDEALEVSEKKSNRVPGVGEYETAANRGTILVHAGRLEEGSAEIDRALELNPDAHFGRERVQKLLVEYVIEKRGDATAVPLPLDPSADARLAEDVAGDPPPFTAFLQSRGVTPEDGLRGVRGMLRFGGHRSPILLEALGDVLLTARRPDAGGNLASDSTTAARLLAARAYLAAGRSAGGPAVAEYRALAEAALRPQRIGGRDATVDGVAAALDREFAEADAWFDKLAEDEALWIDKSPDPDARFRQKYAAAVLKVGDTASRPARIQGHWAPRGLSWTLAAAVGVGGAATLAGVWGLVLYRRHRPNGWGGGGNDARRMMELRE